MRALNGQHGERYASGYTLIEILVVMLIVSVVSGAALLSIGHHTNRQLAAFADTMTQSVTLAVERAMLEPVVLGLTVKDQAFEFASLQQQVQGGKPNVWKPLEDVLLGPHPVPDNIEVSMKVNGVSKNDPKMIISTNGELTPFTIYVGQKGKKPRYAIRGQSDGTVTSTLLS